MIGRVVSHYRILERLSGGSMGVVYRAEDIGLQRAVALKFLSPELTRDVSARKRFTREARAASALDHPNICTIFEIDVTAEGQTFIAMAYYEGETLKQKIRSGALKVAELVDITAQVAAGLGKAHERGIVHRDVKPANVLVTYDGTVKLLDFGLAKQLTAASGDYLTQSGFAMGTPTYMSPEQALGEGINARTDQWALAVMVYEALAGRAPFRGPSKMAVLFAIINRQPEPLSAVRPDLPGELDDVMTRALAKNNDDRYETIEDFAAALARVLEPVMNHARTVVSDDSGTTSVFEQTTDQPTQQGSTRRASRWLLAALAALVLVAGGLLFFFLDRRPPPRVLDTGPLTHAQGLEQYPSVDFESGKVFYISEENGQRDLWVRDLSSDRGYPLSDADGEDIYPAVSPDGVWVAFVSNREGGGLFLLPTRGGKPRRLVALPLEVSENNANWIPTLAWRPDGSGLVYASAFRESGLFGVALEGGGQESLPLPAELEDKPLAQPSFHPEGDRLALTLLTGDGVSVSTIWIVAADGSDALRVTEGMSFDHQPVYSGDGRRLFFLSDRGGSPDIWWVDLDRQGRPLGAAERLTTGIGIGSYALDGPWLVYSKTEQQTNLHFLPSDVPWPATLDATRRLTDERHVLESLDISPDGQWIVFDSNRGGNMDIWMMSRTGDGLRQLTSDKAHDWAPVFSPDGRSIAFHSLRGGNRDIYVMSVAGENGGTQQLTDAPGMDLLPTWSPDGREIAFCSARGGSAHIWIKPAAGGEARQVTSGEGVDRFPAYSPDGGWLAYEQTVRGRSELHVLDLTTGALRQVTRQGWWRVAPYAWSADGETIYVQGRMPTGRPNVYAISVADGTPRAVTDVRGTSTVFQSLAVSEDGFYFPVLESQGDLWLAELGA